MSDSDQNSTSKLADTSNIVSLNRNGDIHAPTGPRLLKEVEVSTGGLPSGFFMREEGIYHLRPSVGGEEVPMLLCSPLTVAARCSKPDGSSWGRVVDVTDPNGKVHRLVIDEADITGSPARLLRTLVDNGLALEPIAKATQTVANLVQSWRPDSHYTRADQLGWTDDKFKSFALGDGRVIGGEKVIFEHQSQPATRAMHTRGSLEDWRLTVAEPCIDNPLMILSVSLAFTGPLLWPLSLDGGGFHLRGASSRGKSTLLGVAASVWGDSSFVQSWRATDNGLEGIASACSGTLGQMLINRLVRGQQTLG